MNQKIKTVINRDTISGFVFLIIFILIIYFSKDIKLLVLSGTLDARFWPRIIGICGCIVSFTLFIQGVISGIIIKAEKNATKPQIEKERIHSNNNNRDVTKKALAIIFIYILGINYLGFLPMTIIYTFSHILILMPKEERNYIKLLIMSVVFSLIVFACFRFGFNVILPSGIIWRLF